MNHNINKIIHVHVTQQIVDAMIQGNCFTVEPLGPLIRLGKIDIDN